MPQSFVCLNCHLIFSTKNREPLIQPQWAPRLYEYIGGTLRNLGSPLVAVGGMPDHVHLMVSMGKQAAVADLVRDIKSCAKRPRSQGLRRWAIAVNLFDPIESDIRADTTPLVKIGYVEVVGSSVWEPARHETWKWILLIGLGVLSLEWYTYNRRITV
jgi:REP element-mobilizing transposase RayT